MKKDATASPPAIEFRNVSLSFGDQLVVNDVSFTLTEGEMICLTGISGSGKSVLLRLAMGLLKPDSGRIFIEGREIENLDESELIEIRGGLMGMVFQEDSSSPAYQFMRTPPIVSKSMAGLRKRLTGLFARSCSLSDSKRRGISFPKNFRAE